MYQLTVTDDDYPERLRAMDKPPQRLYYSGAALGQLLERPCVAIVGSRSLSAYGKQVTAQFASALAEQGIVIVSGLAFGVDSVAHQACLDAGGLTIAVLPTPLDRVHPRSHAQLAKQILEAGGALVSEYAPGMPGLKQNFIARNRIVAGLTDALLITEAAEKSGSLHTARFAWEQGKAVMAIPGSIYSPTSVGVNNLLKFKAIAVTSYKDVLGVLQVNDHTTPIHKVIGRNHDEQLLLDLMLQGHSHGDDLLAKSGLSASQYSQVMTMLELSDKIQALGADQWGII